MLRIDDTLAGDRIQFNYAGKRTDLDEVAEYVESAEGHWLGIDTESTGINCYRRGWEFRTLQIGDAYRSYVIPARYPKFIGWVMEHDIKWIAHNGPHDIRSIDTFLGRETGVECAGETYIPAHHYDSRKQDEGGVAHGLKEQCIARIDRDSGRWETALKKAFKEITIPIPGETYKSGPRKGLQKVRKARLSEGWALIDPEHPAYIAYAAVDPILAYRLWKWYQPTVRRQLEWYRFDKQVQAACDELQRRAIRLDVRYTQRLDAAYVARAESFKQAALGFGCQNINSGAQIAAVLLNMGEVLTARTEKGAYKTDDGVLRGIAARTERPMVKEFIHCVLGAKQLLKRRENYTQAMLREMDSAGRVHPSINHLGARTTRMSVSGPALQQLPTKDREEDAE